MSKYMVDNTVIDTHSYLDSDHYRSTLMPDMAISAADSFLDVGYMVVNLFIQIALLGGCAFAAYRLSSALLMLVKMVYRKVRGRSTRPFSSSPITTTNNSEHSQASTSSTSSTSGYFHDIEKYAPDLTDSPESDYTESFPSSPVLNESITTTRYALPSGPDNSKDQHQQYHQYRASAATANNQFETVRIG